MDATTQAESPLLSCPQPAAHVRLVSGLTIDLLA